MYKADIIIIFSSNITCSHHDMAEKLLIWFKQSVTHSSRSRNSL